MGKNRKRGKRKQSNLPSHMRVALREERLANNNNSGEEDVGAVVESIEEQGAALAEELNELLSAEELSEPQSPAPQSSPDREVSWSLSPEPEDNVAGKSSSPGPACIQR